MYFVYVLKSRIDDKFYYGMTNNLVNKPEKDELFLDQTLRPAMWDEYVGQQNIKSNLNI